MTSVEWTAQALCARNWDNDYDATAPDWFADRSNGKSSKAAITLCRLCPVAQECLQLALKCENKASDREGIYGGLTPDDREALWPSNPEPIVRGRNGVTHWKATPPGRNDELLARLETGMSLAEVAEEYGLHRSTVHKACGQARRARANAA